MGVKEGKLLICDICEDSVFVEKATTRDWKLFCQYDREGYKWPPDGWVGGTFLVPYSDIKILCPKCSKPLEELRMRRLHERLALAEEIGDGNYSVIQQHLFKSEKEVSQLAYKMKKAIKEKKNDQHDS